MPENAIPRETQSGRTLSWSSSESVSGQALVAACESTRELARHEGCFARDALLREQPCIIQIEWTLAGVDSTPVDTRCGQVREGLAAGALAPVMQQAAAAPDRRTRGRRRTL